MREKDIKHENGNYWVGYVDSTYTVFKLGATHSVSVQAFKADSDGLSCAIAYCDFLAKCNPQKWYEIDPDFAKNSNYGETAK